MSVYGKNTLKEDEGGTLDSRTDGADVDESTPRGQVNTPEAACGGRGAVARPLDSPTARLRAGPSSPAGSSVLGSHCDAGTVTQADDSRTKHAITPLIAALGEASHDGCDATAGLHIWRRGRANREPLAPLEDTPGSPHLSWFDPCRSANAFGRQQQQQKEQDLMCCREPAPLLR
ncbi:unnamed protein product [Lampetra fluviatilis]